MLKYDIAVTTMCAHRPVKHRRLHSRMHRCPDEFACSHSARSARLIPASERLRHIYCIAYARHAKGLRSTAFRKDGGFAPSDDAARATPLVWRFYRSTGRNCCKRFSLAGIRGTDVWRALIRYSSTASLVLLSATIQFGPGYLHAMCTKDDTRRCVPKVSSTQEEGGRWS